MQLFEHLLRETARRRSDLRFEVIGFGEPPGVEVPGNVRLLGAVPHELLAQHALRWDVATVPFREGPLARAVDPISDVSGSADYRRRVVAVEVRRALEELR